MTKFGQGVDVRADYPIYVFFTCSNAFSYTVCKFNLAGRTEPNCWDAHYREYQTEIHKIRNLGQKNPPVELLALSGLRGDIAPPPSIILAGSRSKLNKPVSKSAWLLLKMYIVWLQIKKDSFRSLTGVLRGVSNRPFKIL